MRLERLYDRAPQPKFKQVSAAPFQPAVIEPTTQVEPPTLATMLASTPAMATEPAPVPHVDAADAGGVLDVAKNTLGTIKRLATGKYQLSKEVVLEIHSDMFTVRKRKLDDRFAAELDIPAILELLDHNGDGMVMVAIFPRSVAHKSVEIADAVKEADPVTDVEPEMTGDAVAKE